MDFDDLDSDDLQDLISKLEIKVDNIYHCLLSNGMEMMGELFPAEQITDEEIDDLDEEDQEILEFVQEENNLLFLNPIRIERRLLQDDNGELKSNSFFTEWNPHIDGPFTHMNKDNIIAMNKPNSESLVYYLKTIWHIYYPVLDEIPDGDLSLIGEKIILKESITIPKNIIDFEKYHSKRLNKKF